MEIMPSLSSSGALICSLVVGISMHVGSGGSVYVASLLAVNTKVLSQATFETKVAQIKLDVEKQVNFIETVFSLSEEKLAECLQVERKTVYNWKKNNHIPRNKSREKFFKLYTLANSWHNLGYPSGKMLSQQGISNQLLEILPSLDEERILFLGRALMRQLPQNTPLL
ncbi:hypothetical protein [Pelistega europaea]|uniref:Uncharacterized protein n=1 Tax=Pelistega europaea TaxID=106147 RepID=A0A7Y4P4D3_9BURK|nr:hypothetical protein [Pelistega europaea]NOL48598.1 hypothetical protein [Pelistega europaea]